MKQFVTPGVQETRQILLKVYTKSARPKGRAQLEAIKAKLDDVGKKHSSRN